MLLAIDSERYYHVGMHLEEFLSRPDAPKVAQLRQRMNELGADLKDDAQIRQWIAFKLVKRKKVYKRRPGPKYCRYLELATDGVVSRRDMRPDDYADIWPELAAQQPT